MEKSRKHWKSITLFWCRWKGRKRSQITCAMYTNLFLENVIYCHELFCNRAFMDVGEVECFKRSSDGGCARWYFEVDFVVNRCGGVSVFRLSTLSA